MAWDWQQYAVSGAQRPDSFSGMQGEFSSALEQMFVNAPPEIQAEMRVSSGYRSPARQAQLWQEALAKYGSPEAARKWVAPPGNSQHNHGNAADLKYLSPAAQEWAHQNAARYGLAFPLSNEPWHIEAAGARGGIAQTAPQNGLGGIVPAQPGQSPQNALGAVAAPPQAPQFKTTQLDPRAFQMPQNQLSLIYNS